MSDLDITLVGEFNVDLVLYGLPEDLPLERELLANGMAFQLGGSPAITANNLARLGSRVGLISARANDIFADYCISELSNSGVDLSKLVAAPSPTKTGISVLLQHQSVRRCLTYPGSTNYLTLDALDLGYLCRARHFHLSSFYLQQGLQQDVPRLFALLKEAGLSISLDTNDDPAATWGGPIHESLQYVDILMPNEREAKALVNEDSFEFAVEQLASRVPMLVVKRGALGALVIHGGKTITQPAVAVQVVDAVGAGDSFNAGFLHGYLQSRPIGQCLTLGNLAGAYSTTGLGGISAFSNPTGMHSFFRFHGAEV